MSIARQIRVQKLQNKHRMTGATFNPSGVTSEQLAQRERVLIEKWSHLKYNEIVEYYNNNLKSHYQFCEEHQISQSFELCVFSRHYHHIIQSV